MHQVSDLVKRVTTDSSFFSARSQRTRSAGSIHQNERFSLLLRGKDSIGIFFEEKQRCSIFFARTRCVRKGNLRIGNVYGWIRRRAGT